MLFNSLSFAIFLPLVFILYWFVSKNNLKLQNILLIISSYFFYACWDWRFLFLLIFSTCLDFFCGSRISINLNPNRRKSWLWFSIIVNLGILGLLKYYNFFSQSFIDFLSFTGLNINLATLNVVLPVGISFYTFHGLSYVLDIYNRKINPEHNFINYSLFVSFFPLLVAGPIERATHLLPQIVNKRNFDYSQAVNGMRQILWGLFKKIVIADNCAQYVNPIFENTTQYTGSSLLIGAIFFSFQIYCDFSGYSDIALGTAKLFGIQLLRNFAFPYFSRDISEFWRRWHISLSSWFRDYLYIPLGGSLGSTWMKIRNTCIIFIVSGFWHGANWTFIFWGALNALYILPLIFLKKNRTNIDIVANGRILPAFSDFLKILLTFALTTFAWIFFRAKDLNHALLYIKGLLSKSLFKIPNINFNMHFITTVFFICVLIAFEWKNRQKTFALEVTNNQINSAALHRKLAYILLVYSIFVYGGNQQEFIYFQF